MKKLSISEQLSKKGFKLRTWAKAKGLSDSDYNVLLDLSKGKTKGKWGKAKELKELLHKEFKIALDCIKG